MLLDPICIIVVFGFSSTCMGIEYLCNCLVLAPAKHLQLKGPPFYHRNLPDPKVLWNSRTLEEVRRFALKMGVFKKIFYKSHVKLGKMKISKTTK